MILCGDDARFINHSDTPNIASDYTLDPYGADIAVRDIEAGEEITTGYKSLFLALPLEEQVKQMLRAGNSYGFVRNCLLNTWNLPRILAGGRQAVHARCAYSANRYRGGTDQLPEFFGDAGMDPQGLKIIN